MKRALRVDKVTLAILNATLKHYVNSERLVENLPLLRTLTLTQPQLQKRAETVLANLPNDLKGVIVPSKAQIGSGALPDQNIDSIAVSLNHSTLSAQKLAKALRYAAVPIIGRIKDKRVLLDMHGADPLEELIDVLNRVEI
jgi:L-seryl-tRNA(Ser) seleniumtransferase